VVKGYAQFSHLYVFQMLMDNIRKSAQPDMSCPSHPAPLIPMPSPLPANISGAIETVLQIFSNIVDSSSVCAMWHSNILQTNYQKIRVH